MSSTKPSNPRVVFQLNPDWAGPHAELELSRRMTIAAERLGLPHLATSDHDRISEFAPDIVVALHFTVPKLFDAHTVGCMWNPWPAVDHNNAWDHLATYDTYGVASRSQMDIVRALRLQYPAPYSTLPLYPTSQHTEYQPPSSFDGIAYIGANWDPGRHSTILGDAVVRVYGPGRAWRKERVDYRGELACDGTSALAAYRDAGLGLSLHGRNHRREGIPSMRPFEIAASGALMISDDHPFVREHFGDAPLYLDTDRPDGELGEQLRELLAWARAHPGQATERARATHEVFESRYTWEAQLEALVEQWRQPARYGVDSDGTRVEILVRTDGSDVDRLLRALASIERQTHSHTCARLVYRGASKDLPQLEASIRSRLPGLEFEMTQSSGPSDRGAQFFLALRACESEQFGFLDDDDVLFADHVQTLTTCLAEHPEAPLAYGGSVRIWDGQEADRNEPARALAFFHGMDGFENRDFLTSNAYLARRDAIPPEMLRHPAPALSHNEDSLFLRLLHRRNPRFVFSGKVTSAFYWDPRERRNSVFEDHQDQHLFLIATRMPRLLSPWGTPPPWMGSAAGTKRMRFAARLLRWARRQLHRLDIAADLLRLPRD